MGLRSWVENFINATASSGPVRVAESTPDLDYEDIDSNLPGIQAAGNWRRITQAASDLSPYRQDRMQAIALHLSDRNPWARGILDLTVSFVVGEGIVATSKDENVQVIIDRFWNDGQNDMDSRVDDLTRELSIFGEQLILSFVNQRSGRVALVSVDPRQIRAVMPHPLATDRPFAVALAPDVSSAGDFRWVKIIDEDDDPSSDTVGKLIGAPAGTTFKLGDRTLPFYQPKGPDGEAPADTVLDGCFFWPINKPRAAMRGRSDLLAIADNLDAVDTYMFDEGQRMSFQRVFAFVCKLTGASQEEVDKRAATSAAPRPGGVLFVNESEEWSVIAPDLNTQDTTNYLDTQVATFGTATGLPKPWLNGTMDVNRATATEMTDPGIKRLTRRQKYIRRAIERIIRYVLDQAEMAGALAPAGDEGHQFAVIVPEMSGRDMERSARSMLTTVQALGMASAAGWIDTRTAQDAVALMLGQLGIDVDMDDVRERLEQAAAEQADADSEEGGRIPDFFGQGALPGSDSLTRAMSGGGRTNGTNGTAHAAPAPDMVAAMSPAAKDIASTIKTVTDSLVALGNAKVIDGVFAQDVVARLYALLGIQVDVEEMRARLEAEEAPAPVEPAEGPPVAPGEEPPGGLLDLDALAEAFDAAAHPRAAGGRFGEKPGGGEQSAPGAGQWTPPSATAKPKTTKKAAHPALPRAKVTDALSSLQQGDAVTLTLTNGMEVSGQITVTSGGSAVMQTADGRLTILHPGLKGLAKVATAEWDTGEIPEKTATPRAPRAPRTAEQKAASAAKSAATRATKKAAATSA